MYCLVKQRVLSRNVPINYGFACEYSPDITATVTNGRDLFL